ncbi:MAG: FtsX-like permease family protein [Xanthomonadaceae bacterium]|nr:FtsX-like permease family protein [Xanthomonadaceae bacterium]MDP2183945.1 FtsX-like permease family protein [Xanthomonadales bacterium]MDZ4116512.1 FtsX-like permease family protein [Xanthomonadaceae bacterium]MDZ4378732.1 FtsX-like permease family protein [Xanthomonadaceae bacterium]
MVTHLFSDMRNATRSLLRAPLFSLAVLLLLGGGLGLVLSVGTAAWSLLARPLPYPAGERLVEVSGVSASQQTAFGWAPGLLADLRAMPGVEAIGAYELRKPLFDNNGSAFTHAALSPEILRLLGARPLLGSVFANDPGDAEQILLSEATWRSRFGADPAIVGRSIAFDGRRLRVVGVLGRAFRFPSADIALWTPLHYSAEQLRHKDWFALGGVPVLARLAPNADVAQFSQRLDRTLGDLPEIGMLRQFAHLRLQAVSLRDRWVGERRSLLILLSVSVLALLGLLVANVVTLWIGRIVARARELALRSVLGAGISRLLRLVLFEVALLCVGALLLGLALVPTGLRVMQGLGVIDAGLPWRVDGGAITLLSGLAVVALVASVLSVVSYWAIRRISTMSALAQAATARNAGTAGAVIQRALVRLQLALAVALLAAGALLSRSMVNLLDQDLGFRADGVVAAAVDARADGEVTVAQARSLFDAIGALPGVQAVSFTSAMPFSGNETIMLASTRDNADAERFPVRDRVVGAAYFSVMGLPLLYGRGFADAGQSPTSAVGNGVVVDTQFVQRHLVQVDPLSAQLNFAADGEAPEWVPVVGVVPTVRHTGLDEKAELGTVYSVSGDPAAAAGSWLLRTQMDAGVLGERLRSLAGSAGLRITQVTPLQSRIRASVDERMHLLMLVLGFAASSVIVAGFGLFALIALAIRQRRAEFALRIALGASVRSILGLAIRAGLHIALPGLALGVLLALVLGHLLAAQLYLVDAWDGISLLSATALGLLLAVAACLGSAWRLSRDNPMTVLRHE